MKLLREHELGWGGSIAALSSLIFLTFLYLYGALMDDKFVTQVVLEFLYNPVPNRGQILLRLFHVIRNKGVDVAIVV